MITVVIPTHNPKSAFLERTLEALRGQTMPPEKWELLIIDNASSTPVDSALVAWHPAARIVREMELGLTHARLRAIREARGALMVWVDDDNVLDASYLERAAAAFEKSPRLGAAGGRSIPEYQEPPPKWFRLGLAPCGCRDLGPEARVATWDAAKPEYPACAPIGAGMVIRKEAMVPWAEAVVADPRRQALGRKGKSLTSGEDNDINLTVLRGGWDLGYLPELSLTHLIPGTRLTLDYVTRIARVSYRDFVRVLDIHGIRPWPRISRLTIPVRSFRAWLACKGWRGPVERIRWQSAVGQFEGRAQLE
ncbi:glycosyltransferase [Luteolibacter luteus]|uniref:Glycosyltransferase family 2 protein n=1 Tax=Luteolibacter luteus TaxID=2728835 RepID=A0A858RDM9_9BACT|nr:glycosyltransferase [Luteolibacter luteus]QJE94283.1 glycosyltransferase family 2 protein [Luteolibacter luteus]